MVSKEWVIAKIMLTVFGSLAVSLRLASYWLEFRSRWFILTFAVGCGATAAYSALETVYPIAVIEGLWGLVAMDRFLAHTKGISLPG